MTASAAPYPGSTASADEMLRFADSYHRSALALLDGARGGDAIARAPGRYCAIHAIELYLVAFLRGLGESPGRLRVQGHDLRKLAALALAGGLALRDKTRQHLIQLTINREHLVLRYGPDRAASVSELNRLTASLTEIAQTVRRAATGAPVAAPDREAAA